MAFLRMSSIIQYLLGNLTKCLQLLPVDVGVRFSRWYQLLSLCARKDRSELNGSKPACGSIENRVHIHNLHATILHLMGIDHTRLTYRYSGRDYRLTDVRGKVVNGILS